MINDKIALICCVVRNHLLLWRN